MILKKKKRRERANLEDSNDSKSTEVNRLRADGRIERKKKRKEQKFKNLS